MGLFTMTKGELTSCVGQIHESIRELKDDLAKVRIKLADDGQAKYRAITEASRAIAATNQDVASLQDEVGHLKNRIEASRSDVANLREVVSGRNNLERVDFWKDRCGELETMLKQEQVKTQTRAGDFERLRDKYWSEVASHNILKRKHLNLEQRVKEAVTYLVSYEPRMADRVRGIFHFVNTDDKGE